MEEREAWRAESGEEGAEDLLNKRLARAEYSHLIVKHIGEGMGRAKGKGGKEMGGDAPLSSATSQFGAYSCFTATKWSTLP